MQKLPHEQRVGTTSLHKNTFVGELYGKGVSRACSCDHKQTTEVHRYCRYAAYSLRHGSGTVHDRPDVYHITHLQATQDVDEARNDEPFCLVPGGTNR